MAIVLDRVNDVASWTNNISVPTTGIVSGDLVLFLIQTSSNDAITPGQTGWDLADIPGQVAGNGDGTLWGAWRIQAGAPPANYSASWGTSLPARAALLRVLGFDAADVINIAAGKATNNTASHDCPSVVTDKDGCLIVRDTTHQRDPSSNPAGHTTHYHARGSWNAHGLASQIQASQGATGAAIFGSATGGNGATRTIAVNAAAAPPTFNPAFVPNQQIIGAGHAS